MNAPNKDEYLKVAGLDKPPAMFTKNDQTTKERLLSAGFSNWSKKDFFVYIRQCETFGRKDYEKIALGFVNKTPEDVKKYSDSFWKKWQSIENGQKYVERIEKGELEIEKYR